MARWKMLTSEFDIVYMNQKVVKGSVIADFLASRALEDYKIVKFDFPNEDLMSIFTAEEDAPKDETWKMNFDSIERKIKILQVFGDSSLVIYELRGQWMTQDSKLIEYKDLVMNLIKEFEEISFTYLPREENQMADALATLYVKYRAYPAEATKIEKQTLRRLALEYVLDGDILYKKSKIRYGIPERIITDNAFNLNNDLMKEKRMMRAYDKKFRPREFHEGGALVLAEMDGENLSNPVNSDSVKRYYT
ncbi:uncharacterized protein LOC120124020 [Hibiscus syriacus]|uniref:uncharacterized protein LOC120124020 n=1 Tax=Hibiscus syriacus TaxID=106335 RepID=UPI00192157BE|nr:uncharacterized protein LOC120124020 [Hibiscus syriacus]